VAIWIPGPWWGKNGPRVLTTDTDGNAVAADAVVDAGEGAAAGETGQDEGVRKRRTRKPVATAD
jgi:hypothetical protein